MKQIQSSTGYMCTIRPKLTFVQESGVSLSSAVSTQNAPKTGSPAYGRFASSESQKIPILFQSHGSLDRVKCDHLLQHHLITVGSSERWAITAWDLGRNRQGYANAMQDKTEHGNAGSMRGAGGVPMAPAGNWPLDRCTSRMILITHHRSEIYLVECRNSSTSL